MIASRVAKFSATDAAALDRFGPDHLFETHLYYDGQNLHIVGTGDPATGDPRLAKERGGTPLSVIVGDLDRFKRVNDSYGHAAGDEVLRRVGHVVRQAKRRFDTAARVGGDVQEPKKTKHVNPVYPQLAQQARAGLAQRMALVRKYWAGRKAPKPGAPKIDELEDVYGQRLEYEIATIQKMGFSGYFLIVWDFINWAKEHGIPVGPGRGSGAGSLVAYALGITDLDPLTYNLLFERFLNPERVSMPDFDIDFCQDGRDRVIDYVRRKYGADSVSQIATFGTMAARAVVRDVGRVLDLGYNFCDQIAKLVPFQPGRTITLQDAREMEPMLAERERKEDEVRELLQLGETLEGLTRNVGMHAGGVLIAPGKLTDFCPLYAAEGTTNVISQLDKDDVEAIGLVKFDFLGLTTLTVLDWAERFVRELGASEFSLERVPLDDEATYRLISAANTTAVFQLESRGMRDMIKRARPDRFEDIIALVALYRPGPMENIPKFCHVKNGQEKRNHGMATSHPVAAGWGLTTGMGSVPRERSSR